jgi:putative transposase
VSPIVDFIKGKSAIHLARAFGEPMQNDGRQSFWARGYFVSTIGRYEATIRDYPPRRTTGSRKINGLIG